MTTAPLVRPVRPTDFEVCAALHALCFDAPWDSAALQSLVSAPGGFGHLLVDPSDGVPGGFALGRVAAGECEILTVGVSPRYRRRGWGAVLVRALVEEARRRGAGTVVLEAAEDNRAALALYRAAGFRPVGRRRGYYKTPEGVLDARILRLDLADLTAPSRDRHNQPID